MGGAHQKNEGNESPLGKTPAPGQGTVTPPIGVIDDQGHIAAEVAVQQAQAAAGQSVGVVLDLGAGVGVKAGYGLAGVIEPLPVETVVALRVDLPGCNTHVEESG